MRHSFVKLFLSAFLTFSSLFGGKLLALEEVKEPIQLHLKTIDQPFMKQLVSLFGLDTFVEMKGFSGRLALEASECFKEVITLEANQSHYQNAKKLLEGRINARCIKGDCVNSLKKITPYFKGKTLFYLNGHIAYDSSLHLFSSVSITDQLNCIKSCEIKDCVILIDSIPFSLNKTGPTLSQIQDKISEINPNFTFWILGSSAIAFTPQENVSVSETVEACTKSYLFDANSETSSDIIHIEKTLMESFKIKEGRIIDALSKVYTTQKEHNPNFQIWKGLSLMGKSDYFEASRCFHRVLSEGYSHWRVYWYIALSEYQRRNFVEAKRCLTHVNREVPEFQEAAFLLKKINED